MKLRQEQVDKLREGKIALMVDRSNIQTMCIIVKEAFPQGDKNFIDYLNTYSFVNGISRTLDGGDWNDYEESYGYLKLIPIADFFEEEETGIEEIEFKSYQPKTPEERDQMVKDLQAIDFPKELPSELQKGTLTLSKEELILFKLLRMRDVYRGGWVSNVIDVCISKNWFIELYSSENTKNPKSVLSIEWSWYQTRIFSFQDKETAELFLNNFKEELEQVKHLIS